MKDERITDMTDQELDSLFAQSAQSQKAVEQINRQVMKTVRREMRLQTVRRWAKLLAICFGIPFLVVLYIYILYTYMPEMETPLRIITFALPLGTLAVFFGKGLRDFSLFEM